MGSTSLIVNGFLERRGVDVSWAVTNKVFLYPFSEKSLLEVDITVVNGIGIPEARRNKCIHDPD